MNHWTDRYPAVGPWSVSGKRYRIGFTGRVILQVEERRILKSRAGITPTWAREEVRWRDATSTDVTIAP